MTTLIKQVQDVLTLRVRPNTQREFGVDYVPQQFIGLTRDTGRLVYILGMTTNGNWLSRDGHVYYPDNITSDLAEFARQQMEDAHDLADTQACAQQ